MPPDAPVEEGERGDERRKEEKDESYRLARPLPQIHHQEVRGESGTGEQVGDRVIRVSALGARRGKDAADPVKVVTQVRRETKAELQQGCSVGAGMKSPFLSDVGRGDAEYPVGGHIAYILRNRWLMQEAEHLRVVRGREGAMSREELLEAGEETGLEGVANGSRDRGRSGDGVEGVSRAKSAALVRYWVHRGPSDLQTGRSFVSRWRCSQGAILKEPEAILRA